MLNLNTITVGKNLFLDRVAIVTGGSRGIGRSIVLALCREGADCAFTYTKNPVAAESLAKEVQSMGRKATPFQLDVRNFEGTKAFIEEVKKNFGRIDILINNAGITRD